MWIFSVYGFFSVTALPEDRSKLMVRARVKAHLENIQKAFPMTLKSYKIQHWKGRDYQYRMIVPNTAWQAIVAQMVAETTWNNFKDECGKRFGHNSKFLGMLHRIWSLVLNTYPEKSVYTEPATTRVSEVDMAMRGYALHPDDLMELAAEEDRPWDDGEEEQFGDK